MDSFGHPFTWRNNRSNGFIEEKLDRCVANDNWLSLFPSAQRENIIWDSSDHSPIILRLNNHKDQQWRNFREDNKLFRFEARWIHHEDFDSFVW